MLLIVIIHNIILLLTNYHNYLICVIPILVNIILLGKIK